MTNQATIDKWVRIMPDYESFGIWDKHGTEMDINELPVSRIVAWDLGNWQSYFDNFSEFYLPAKLRTKKFNTVWYAKRGLEIAKAIKKELPDWTVIYFDYEKFSPDKPRSEFEYEIL